MWLKNPHRKKKIQKENPHRIHVLNECDPPGYLVRERSRRRGHMHTYGWFMLMFDRKQQNSIKQFPSIKKWINFLKEEKVRSAYYNSMHNRTALARLCEKYQGSFKEGGMNENAWGVLSLPPKLLSTESKFSRTKLPVSGRVQIPSNPLCGQ